jgi:hypothetical protein
MTRKRLCQDDNWDAVLGDPSPRAIRWSTGEVRGRFEEIWSKWHYTEGNGAFTACRRPILINVGPTTFPEENEDLHKVKCRQCLAAMKKAGHAS